VVGEPAVVRLPGQTDHSSPHVPRQLDGYRADPASRPGDDDGVAFSGRDGPHRRVCGRPRDEQGAGHLPRDARRARGQVLRLRDYELGLAGAGVDETYDFVSHRDAFDPLSELLDDAGEVAALTGGERGG
jgi:hypothetical protein